MSAILAASVPQMKLSSAATFGPQSLNWSDGGAAFSTPLRRATLAYVSAERGAACPHYGVRLLLIPIPGQVGWDSLGRQASSSHTSMMPRAARSESEGGCQISEARSKNSSGTI